MTETDSKAGQMIYRMCDKAAKFSRINTFNECFVLVRDMSREDALNAIHDMIQEECRKQ